MIFFILIWSMCTVAFFALASSMSKHQKQIFGHELDASKTRYATIVGWVLLIVALVTCMTQGNFSNMISYWVGVLSFAALFVGLILSYFADQIKRLVIVCISIGILSFIIYIV